MAKNLNVWVTNWQWTGITVPTPQATVDLDLHWVDDAGNPHQWNGTVTFPNDLALVPIPWVKQELEDLMIRAARHQLGIDS